MRQWFISVWQRRLVSFVSSKHTICAMIGTADSAYPTLSLGHPVQNLLRLSHGLKLLCFHRKPYRYGLRLYIVTYVLSCEDKCMEAYSSCLRFASILEVGQPFFVHVLCVFSIADPIAYTYISYYVCIYINYCRYIYNNSWHFIIIVATSGQVPSASSFWLLNLFWTAAFVPDRSTPYSIKTWYM